jgi:TRAP-type mannitol/chloroaromatic compound transport system substrate-binding protein
VVTAPAIGETLPAIKSRLASSFPKSLDTIYQAAEDMAKRVSAITQGKFDIRVHAAGEIVPPFGVMDAVQNATVEMGHTASYYFVGKNKALAFDTALPFGLSTRQQSAWVYHGGGMELLREFFRDFNIINFPGGNTGAQMGGWFRKELTQLADLKGLKMRIAGLGGEVFSALGVVPQSIPGGDIYPSLEKGTIDAAEWVGPYDDEKLGFFKVAPHYYYPGFWEPSATLSFYINAKEWEKLPQTYKEALEVACAEANIKMQAEYDSKNPGALARLLKNGTQLHAYPKDILQAAYEAAMDLFAQESARNPAFKKLYEPWSRFRSDQYNWFKVAEHTYANFAFFAKPG